MSARKQAVKILELPRSEHEAAILALPAYMQSLIREFVETGVWLRQSDYVASIIAQRSRVARAHALDEVPAEDREAVRERVEKIFASRRKAKIGATVADDNSRSNDTTSG